MARRIASCDNLSLPSVDVVKKDFKKFKRHHEAAPAVEETAPVIGENSGRLYVIATPIGNMEDLSIRAKRVLAEVPALACEDTRVTRKILSRYEIPTPGIMIAYHEHNEEWATRRVVGLLASGQNVGLCSNAGVPCLSDPGYHVVRAAIQEGYAIEMLPGPNAAATALVLSGLPPSSYTFLGFPPRKEGQRRRFFAEEAQRPHTMIFHESPYRLGSTLADAMVSLGDRRAAVAIELTKMHETVDRGWLSELAAKYEGKQVKGEITVVIAGANPKFMRASEATEAPEETEV